MKDTNYRLVTTVQGIREYIGDARVAAFDYETAPDDPYRAEERAALDPARSHICTMSLSVAEGTAAMIPVAHRTGGNMDADDFDAFLRRFLSDPKITKVCHNLAFESAFSYARGIVIQAPVYDTICAAQMTLKGAFEFRKLSDSGLKKLSADLCGEPLPSFADVTGGRHFDELDPADPETVRYSCADADFALRLYHLFNGWFDRYLPRHRWIVENLESPTAVFVGLMRYNGIPVDVPAMVAANGNADREIARLAGEISAITGGVAVGSNCSTAAFKDYLYNVQRLPVLKRTEKMSPSVDDEAMLLLKDHCRECQPDLVPLFDRVLEYRKWQKLKSTYLDGYLDYVNTATGRIHPDLMQLATETGRFACRRPNLQNCYDSRTEILTRRGFVPFPDLLPDDEVAQWENGDIYFVEPLEIIRSEYQGDMVQLKNQHIDLLLTPNHRCLLQNRKNNQFYVVTASDYSEDAKQLNAAQYSFGDKSLPDDVVTILAATQADGYVRSGCVEFRFGKARKLLRLLKAIQNLGVPYTDRICANGQTRVTIRDCEITRTVLGLLGEKKTWGPWLLDYDRRTVKQILLELPNWDGCFTRGNHYSSSVRENADWMQIIYVLTGTRTNLRIYWNGNPNSVDNYQLDITDRDYSLTSNVDKQAVPYDGMVYCVSVPSGFVMVRRSGRVCVSGNSPQKGQDPVGIRNFIAAPDGWALLEADYSQAEIRLCAYLSQDRVLLDAYERGADVHAVTTSAIFGITMEEAADHSRPGYKHRRTVAKSTLFGIMYGIGGAGLSRNLYTNAGLTVSREECDAYIEGILGKYTGMARWQRETRRDAEWRGYVETALGRRRYLPGIRSKDYRERSSAWRMAVNTPVQGLGADCLKHAMALLVRKVADRPYIRPVLTVHDSIVFLVREEKVGEASKIVKECMEAAPPLPDFPPLVAEVSVGKRYGEME